MRFASTLILAAVVSWLLCGCGTNCGPGKGESICAGSCVDTQNDNQNCGACGNVCADGTACVAGSCQPRCGSGSTLCDGQCVNVQSDNANCGACGNICLDGKVCASGSCQTSCGPAPSSMCSGQCVDLQTDDLNCGTCGNACPDGTACTAGSCEVTCGAGYSACGNACVDVMQDPQNCGTCGTTCGTGEVCTGGTCHSPCPSGQVYCAGGCIDPQTNDSYCGATVNCSVQDDSAGRACGGYATCQSGSCHVGCPTADGGCGSGAACASNADCADDEVCSASKCVLAFGASYSVHFDLTVTAEEPDGVVWDSNGTPPDPSASLTVTTGQGTLLYFPEESDSFQGSWDEPSMTFDQISDYTGDGALRLGVVDDDTLGSETICGLQLPGTVLSVLHQGSITTSGDGCESISLSFTPN